MTRVLFVDDEQEVLEGLRDLLRRQRRDWTMTFALGGQAALAELEASQYDIVVSDVRMPGLDGPSLLEHVQELYPGMARIVLSGQTDEAAAVRTASVAHRSLAKPCPHRELVAAIESACAVRELLLDTAVRDAVGAARLPSAPTVYRALQRALASPDPSLAEVAAVIEDDVALCAKVLQLVNSSFFGLGRRITRVHEAAVYLGLGTLKALVLSVEVFGAFDTAPAVAGFDVAKLDAHSRLVARAAADLARPGSAGDGLTAGLLHDVGVLVLAAHRPDRLEPLLFESARRGASLHEVEAERYGVTHAEIGAYLLALWNLPDELVTAVSAHHAPEGGNGTVGAVALAELRSAGEY
jgi:HD-like signal output (HDOD) protein